MLVSTRGKSACVRICGRANFTSNIDFKTLLNELLNKGFARFVLDLRECALMDSTFLGVLAGFGLRLNGPQPDSVERRIELYQPNARITDLLENLGVLHLFHLTQDITGFPDGAPGQEPVPAANPSREEVTRNCLEAHQTLMNVNPDNVARFKDVAAFLAEDLKRIKTAEN